MLFMIINFVFPISSKSFKVKKTELVNRLGPTGSGSSTGSANHHGHPPKKKNIAEMIVDRVFRKTGSSFKVKCTAY